MHELLIGFLIVVIVAIQIYIFSLTLEKIKIFKNILPNQENFRKVKVFLKESEIENISLVNVYKNIPLYSNKNRGSNFKEVKEINHEYSNYKTADVSDKFVHDEKDNSQNLNKNKQLKVNFGDEDNKSDMLFEIETDKKSLIINQEVNIKFTINKVAADFIPQPFDGFKLISGPKLNLNKSWINGKMVYSKSYSYLLKPLKTGDLVIRKASAKCNGEVYESNSITIKVKEY